MATTLPSLFTKHAIGGHGHGHARPSSQLDAANSKASPVMTNGHAHTAYSQHSNGGMHTLQPQPHASTSGTSGSSTSYATSNVHLSTANIPASPITPSSATSSHHSLAASSSSSNSFIRSGDTVYSQGAPPAAPLPSVADRDYTVLKEVGDGSFGTVWLADWHSPLAIPKGTKAPGPSTRPEYKGKRLVALKRMKKAFEGGWDECMKLKELKSLRAIPIHDNIIPLYDSFLMPSSKELYFVFECMEGNLYQLTKSRKGRPLAAGLVADLFKQMLAGLHHIHQCGFFHRDMKPENLLITTTGLADYPGFVAQHNAGTPRAPEKDVVAIVKIADFGLARETYSRPPYTEYVSTRWYRAPEVLLRSRDYSAPVDMWAVGTILFEMVTLKPLFPGSSEIDQVFRICEVLGDPCLDYGVDDRGRTRGGGNWERGLKMAKQVGFSFPKMLPTNFIAQFDLSQVPLQLVDIMADLMRYDPRARLTTDQCLRHPYFSQVADRLIPTLIPTAQPTHVQQAQRAQQAANKALSPTDPYAVSAPSPRDVPPSHSHQTPYGKPAFDTQPQSGLPGLPSPLSSTASPSTGTEYYSLPSASSAQANGMRQSMAPSMTSGDSHGLGGVQIHVTGDNMRSPGIGYPESVADVTMEDGQYRNPAYAQAYNEQQRLPLPNPSVHVTTNPYRQGANGYAGSTHSYGGSYYDPSVYSGYSAHSGRRGSAGGASTFYDGSIFEGIAPTRAASILSFPANYGEDPPAPKFGRSASLHSYSQHSIAASAASAPPVPAINPLLASLRGRARHDSDNFSVDFEREALQRSQNAAISNSPHIGGSDGTESIKKGKEGKRNWMSSVFNSSSHDRPVVPHPQQQALIVPAAYAAQQAAAQEAAQQAAAAAAQSSAASIYSTSGTSLKRTPSERSVIEPPPVQPALPLDPKKAKKEQERLAKEAEKAKRDAAQKAARDRARAVMQKRNALAQAADPLHNYGANPGMQTNKLPPMDKEKQRLILLEAAARKKALLDSKLPQISEDPRARLQLQMAVQQQQSLHPDNRYKARRRDDDDDVHSMSSNETRSERRFSISSQNTVSTVSTTNTFESDPGQRNGRIPVSPHHLAPSRRSPSIASRISVGSQNSGHSTHSRREISTSHSNASSLETGLVGRFQGLTATETVDGGRNDPSPEMQGQGPYANYYQQTPSAQYTSSFAKGSPVSLPGIQSFDRPPKEFSFPHHHQVPRSSHSQHSNSSTISGHSHMLPPAGMQQGLPLTPEMHERHLQEQQRDQLLQQQRQQQQQLLQQAQSRPM